MFGMEIMVTHACLRYTWDYLTLGICSLIKPGKICAISCQNLYSHMRNRLQINLAGINVCVVGFFWYRSLNYNSGWLSMRFGLTWSAGQPFSKGHWQVLAQPQWQGNLPAIGGVQADCRIVYMKLKIKGIAGYLLVDSVNVNLVPFHWGFPLLLQCKANLVWFPSLF